MSNLTSLQRIEEIAVMVEYEYLTAEAPGYGDRCDGPGTAATVIALSVAVGSSGYVSAENFHPALVAKWEAEILKEHQE